MNVAGIHQGLDRTLQFSPDRLRHAATISVWARWYIWGAAVIELTYRGSFDYGTYIPYIAMHVVVVALNGSLHYRLISNQPLSWRWVLAPSVIDAVLLTTAIAVGGGFSVYYFLAYYPALALFAVLFTSIWLSLAWATLVVAAYTVVSLTVGTGLNLETADEKELFARIVALYAVVVAVNLAAGFERTRRRQAVEREQALQQERIELSQTIHDTAAQAAYMIELGLENAIDLAGESNEELSAALAATSALSRSAMWDLRQPIDAGQIFDGRPLGLVLGSHTETFTTITSIPARLAQTGNEPPIPTETRARLFSIAHNALTNAFRHAQASNVAVHLDFGADDIRLSVTDDGVGLPSDYPTSGHGFRSMQTNTALLGGEILVESGGPAGGTTITCVVPYDQNRGGNEVGFK